MSHHRASLAIPGQVRAQANKQKQYHSAAADNTSWNTSNTQKKEKKNLKRSQVTQRDVAAASSVKNEMEMSDVPDPFADYDDEPYKKIKLSTLNSKRVVQSIHSSTKSAAAAAAAASFPTPNSSISKKSSEAGQSEKEKMKMKNQLNINITEQEVKETVVVTKKTPLHVSNIQRPLLSIQTQSHSLPSISKKKESGMQWMKESRGLH